ncbi:hypothetical protein BD410DRAFT_897593 [Rickenella mellea]|uniref:Transmembrane protein n=1 Tax=Rickenella mellea TaxID=50990 RepID=A0A4Y7Q7Z5_9AGAM|nr:hypothetical protein BD410DRAFT_897593 [Rickenella mellea]
MSASGNILPLHTSDVESHHEEPEQLTEIPEAGEPDELFLRRTGGKSPEEISDDEGVEVIQRTDSKENMRQSTQNGIPFYIPDELRRVLMEMASESASEHDVGEGPSRHPNRQRTVDSMDEVLRNAAQPIRQTAQGQPMQQGPGLRGPLNLTDQESAELRRILYDNTRLGLPSSIWRGIVARNLIAVQHGQSSSIEGLTQQYRCLVAFLLQKGKETAVSDFTAVARKKLAGVEGWPTKEDVKEENKTIWTSIFGALDFTQEKMPKEITWKKFIDMPNEIFPPLTAKQKKNAHGQVMFDFTFEDMEDVGLRIEGTSTIQEHLLLSGKKVYVYQFDWEDMEALLQYDESHVAKALGLAQLGDEIIYSITCMSGKDPNMTKAIALNILRESQGVSREIVGKFCYSQKPVDPNILASRVYAIQKRLKKQRRFWPTLKRDVREQRKKQPIFFYGTLLTLFFGVCTIIQTVASVWSLQAALNQSPVVAQAQAAAPGNSTG